MHFYSPINSPFFEPLIPLGLSCQLFCVHWWWLLLWWFLSWEYTQWWMHLQVDFSILFIPVHRVGFWMSKINFGRDWCPQTSQIPKRKGELLCQVDRIECGFSPTLKNRCSCIPGIHYITFECFWAVRVGTMFKKTHYLHWNTLWKSTNIPMHLKKYCVLKPYLACLQ